MDLGQRYFLQLITAKRTSQKKVQASGFAKVLSRKHEILVATTNFSVQNRQYGKLGEVEMAIQPNQQFKMIVHQEKKKKKIKEETSVVEKAPKRNEDHLRSGIPVAKKKHRK